MSEQWVGTAADSEVSQFYIPAVTSLSERRLRALKHGDSFGLFNHYGDIVPFRGAPDGLYHGDTRHLSRFELRLNGQLALLLSSTMRDDNAMLVVDLTNPDLMVAGELVLARERLHVQRLRYLWQGTCYERVAVRNYHPQPCTTVLTLRFESDFADLFEVRGLTRQHRGVITVKPLSARALALRYAGLDGLLRTTMLRFSPEPTRLDGSVVRFDLILAPQQCSLIFVEVECSVGVEGNAAMDAAFTGCMVAARRSLARASARSCRIATSNSQFNQLIGRSMSDLQMLVTDTPHGPYPYAGIPWFCTAFGRDGLLTALFTLWHDPAIARGVLRFLAAHQAQTVDADRDAQPGKILHETRSGEMAHLREVPFGLYYGSVDATPLFVALAGLYINRTGDHETLRILWPHIEKALTWIDRYGDADGDGFVEYNRCSDLGLVNQGWKDSHDSVFHADGRLAQGPIALCEVQAYVYMAKRHAAGMARLLEHAELAVRLDLEADALQQRFDEAFWCDDIGTYALALDGDKQPCRVRTSNAGHALFAGIAGRDRAAQIADGLLDPEFFGGWGIRTVAASEQRYNPMSYHNGSIWPHDNAVIALGLDRYGLKDGVLRILSALFDVSNYVDLRRLPELLCGFDRQVRTGPTFYPVACAPQAWATSAPFALLQAALGLHIDHSGRQVRLVHPRFPGFLDKIDLHGLHVGDTAIDLQVVRAGSTVAVNVLRPASGVDVVVEK